MGPESPDCRHPATTRSTCNSLPPLASRGQPWMTPHVQRGGLRPWRESRTIFLTLTLLPGPHKLLQRRWAQPGLSIPRPPLSPRACLKRSPAILAEQAGETKAGGGRLRQGMRWKMRGKKRIRSRLGCLPLSFYLAG